MPSVAPSAKRINYGFATVMYVNAKGIPIIAHVMGATGDNLDLRLDGFPHAQRDLTAVPKRTAMNQTGVWFNGGY